MDTSGPAALATWFPLLVILGLIPLLAGFVFGIQGALFFIDQGLVAAATLEVINYIEHYGLQRSRDESGRYERVDHRHSWNASARLANRLLFQLQRHSDHHAHACRHYQVLLHHADSPQLPAGYAAMFVLARAPPLWRRVMDPRVQGYYSEAPPPIPPGSG